MTPIRRTCHVHLFFFMNTYSSSSANDTKGYSGSYVESDRMQASVPEAHFCSFGKIGW